MTDLPTMFHSLITASINAEGVFPHQVIIRRPGGKVDACALHLPEVIVMGMVRQAVQGGAEEVIYGIDRFTKPHQGTELGDIIAAGWYRRDAGWQIGIIEYQHAPRIVRPWNWTNSFWSAAIGRELSQFFPDLRLVTPDGSLQVGRA